MYERVLKPFQIDAARRIEGNPQSPLSTQQSLLQKAISPTVS